MLCCGETMAILFDASHLHGEEKLSNHPVFASTEFGLQMNETKVAGVCR